MVYGTGLSLSVYMAIVVNMGYIMAVCLYGNSDMGYIMAVCGNSG